VTGHWIPFGKHAGKSPADVPADYLVWMLRNCKLSTGLRAAIRADLIRRSVDSSKLPPEQEPAPPPRCRRCGGMEMRLYWQELAGKGARTIRADCKRCGRFTTFVPQTAANVAQADAADRPAAMLDALTLADAEGVELVNVAGRHLRICPHGKASAELERLVRESNHLLLAMLPVEGVERIEA
jgi:hypothetical protein